MDHISIVVRSLEASGKFYDAVLGTLGWKRIMNFPYMIAYGPAAPVFFIVQKPEADVKASQLGGVHFAFSAPNPDAVKTCYETAIANGATDNGPAGPRPAVRS